MKITISVIVTVCLMAGLWFGLDEISADETSAPPATYEYKVFSLIDMFADSPRAQAMDKKIGQMMVRVSGAMNGKEIQSGFRRTDMDAADYQEALNRLAAQGWELVAVNKSNYWIFRRKKR